MSTTTTTTTGETSLVEQLLDKGLASFPEITVDGVTYSLGYAHGVAYLYRYDAATEDHVPVARVTLTAEVTSC